MVNIRLDIISATAGNLDILVLVSKSAGHLLGLSTRTGQETIFLALVAY